MIDSLCKQAKEDESPPSAAEILHALDAARSTDPDLHAAIQRGMYVGRVSHFSWLFVRSCNCFATLRTGAIGVVPVLWTFCCRVPETPGCFVVFSESKPYRHVWNIGVLFLDRASWSGCPRYTSDSEQPASKFAGSIEYRQ